MERFFGANEAEGFTAFSGAHWAALTVFAALVLALYGSRNWFTRGNRALRGRIAIALILVLCETGLNVWYAAEGIYDVRYTLPLELCSISLYLSVFMLLFKSRLLFQVVYFTGIGGALMALATPVLWYAFPHFRFFEFFAAHIAIILGVLYLIWVEGFRPTFKSVFLAMGYLNVLLVAVGTANFLTGGNYMFLAHKPETASLLDYLGPYPWYLLSLEAAALVIFLLMYLPFALGSARPKNPRLPHVR
ncbi:TIGR02206 family membrane protein [Paenibacillus chitinolyticus]|uniref:TIGR02206 family membrane protein n=1 Tax=Paenibacillus chitinolyticus TaxID=79263 RepID=A0A410X059_9BACL|nr:TIGR02206 family membrane protein [Paenibacillus chitinolyticus]MCY9590149.1 TIGR02206 family membrane protein [Paenibacillus chitinolyticus]MCY9596845.1 TIGR02206 family membrane protein [Paenibacillus chitinolyticus]QAV19841.1 TIGR02206 family membrane protein [Paenibacillus chitinolyticus]